MYVMKMTKDIVPENFTLSLALVDAIPVIFFGIDMVILGRFLKSSVFVLGALICLVSGALKVLWKIIVVLKKKNVWPLFLQMRMIMPAGLLMIIVSFVGCLKTADLSAFVRMPSLLFFILGLLGMGLMVLFAYRLDSSDLRSNWIEQLTNGFAQIMFFIGLCLL